MKISEALKSQLSDLREKEEPGKRPVYNIVFKRNNGEMDETQFTCECEETAPKELEDFFEEFCRENGFNPESVISIYNDRVCENCGRGTKERVLGNGITEPPYLLMIRCPFDKKYYKALDDYCTQWLEKNKENYYGKI